MVKEVEFVQIGLKRGGMFVKNESYTPKKMAEKLFGKVKKVPPRPKRPVAVDRPSKLRFWEKFSRGKTEKYESELELHELYKKSVAEYIDKYTITQNILLYNCEVKQFTDLFTRGVSRLIKADKFGKKK